jgi:hypothetical protein
MTPDPQTEELKVQQLQREATERRMAETSSEADEAAQHERRAAKAEYLRAKLEQREQSERELEG